MSAKLRGLNKILAALIDTFSSATALSAATTFSGVPTVSGIAANSSVSLANTSDQATFSIQISVGSAFNGTLSFYGLEPDGSTLQLVNAHQRGTTTIANTTAINTGVATNQVWQGAISGFKAIYVVCTAYTSGSVSVQLGLSAAPYAQAILNTINANIAQIGGTPLSLGQATMAASIPVTIASNQSAIPVSGTITATNPSVGSDGSAAPTSSTQIGGSDGTNLQPLQVDGAKNLKINLAAGTAATNADTTIGGTTAPAKALLIAGKTNDGTPQYQPLPEGAGGRSVIVEGYAGGTAVPVSAASLPLPSNAAQETGGNLATLASIVASSKAAVKAGSGDFADGAIATLGTEADSAWGLSGNATVIALLKELNLLLQHVAYDATTRLQSSLYGKNSAAGDTALGVDSNGFLYTHQKLAGSDLADSNAMPTIANIQQMVLNGKGYSCSTGLITAAANQAFSFFVPNTSTKNVLIWSVRVAYGNASQTNQFQYLTADDSNITAGTSCAGNAVNLKYGGAASASGFAMHYNSAVASVSGTALDESFNPINNSLELLSPGMFLLIPAGTAGGIAVYTGTTASGKWAGTVRFCEY